MLALTRVCRAMQLCWIQNRCAARQPAIGMRRSFATPHARENYVEVGRACLPGGRECCGVQHRELRRRQRHAARCGLRPDEAPALQALGQQHQALAVEPQHLEDVAAPAAEDEDVAAKRVGRERGLRHSGQAVEALPHVGVSGDDPHPRVRRQADHASSLSVRKTLRRLASSTVPRNRTPALPISTSMLSVVARAGANGGCCGWAVSGCISGCTVTGSSVGIGAGAATTVSRFCA